MRSIEFFAGSAGITAAFRSHKIEAFSLDIVNLRGCGSHNFLMDFLDFNYLSYPKDYFDIIYFGVPCTAFSKASGGLHFDKNFKPLTKTALKSEIIVSRVFDIISYFSSAVWYIENPSGGLFRYLTLKKIIPRIDVYVYRIDQVLFGFPTKKQTDIFTNSTIPFLINPVHRVNGKYQKVKFDNLTLKQRQAYTVAFCDYIVNNALNNF